MKKSVQESPMKEFSHFLWKQIKGKALTIGKIRTIIAERERERAGG